MFFRLPFHPNDHLQQIVLVLNTVLLIAALVLVELVYSERPKQERRQLLYFLPLFLVFGGLLIYAAYLQAGKS